ncbi:MAG: diguanylate cyclase [Chloroflexi bacterium]|nr:diguanylate cyclase [Chloroflexota bacterium]
MTQGLSRSTDTAVRYGGEEFAIILPETGQLDGRTFMARCTGGKIHGRISSPAHECHHQCRGRHFPRRRYLWQRSGAYRR